MLTVVLNQDQTTSNAEPWFGPAYGYPWVLPWRGYPRPHPRHDCREKRCQICRANFPGPLLATDCLEKCKECDICDVTVTDEQKDKCLVDPLLKECNNQCLVAPLLKWCKNGVIGCNDKCLEWQEMCLICAPVCDKY